MFSSKISSCTCVSVLGVFIIFSAVLFSSNCSFLGVLTSVFSRRGIKPILLEIPPGIFFHVIARDRVPQRNQRVCFPRVTQNTSPGPQLGFGGKKDRPDCMQSSEIRLLANRSGKIAVFFSVKSEYRCEALPLPA